MGDEKACGHISWGESEASLSFHTALVGGGAVHLVL